MAPIPPEASDPSFRVEIDPPPPENPSPEFRQILTPARVIGLGLASLVFAGALLHPVWDEVSDGVGTVVDVVDGVL